jgi:hypothetical protein
MKRSMTGQDKCDLLIQVTAWASLTASYLLKDQRNDLPFGSILLYSLTYKLSPINFVCFIFFVYISFNLNKDIISGIDKNVDVKYSMHNAFLE